MGGVGWLCWETNSPSYCSTKATLTKPKANTKTNKHKTNKQTRIKKLNTSTTAAEQTNQKKQPNKNKPKEAKQTENKQKETKQTNYSNKLFVWVYVLKTNRNQRNKKEAIKQTNK